MEVKSNQSVVHFDAVSPFISQNKDAYCLCVCVCVCVCCGGVWCGM